MKEFFTTLWEDPAKARKFLVALIGAVAVAVSVGLLPAMVGDVAAVAVAFMTAYGVYATPNEKEGNK